MAVLARSRARSEGVAPALAPLFRSLFGDRLPFSLRFWDGSGLGPEDAGATVVLRSPLALRRILYSPDEIGFGRAYVTGELDVEGDLLAAMESLEDAGADLRIVPRVWLATMGRALTMGVLGPPLPPPSEEAHVRGWRHSQERDAQAIAHHYDVGNDFYRLVLGPAMTYSCARFVHPDDTLEEAQEAKHELICAKLGLQPGMR
ncbi:MAG: class I SAM-dependent methyltransferase, partial [Acidimicrobiales bacterium]